MREETFDEELVRRNEELLAELSNMASLKTTLCFDTYSGRYFWSDPHVLDNAVKERNIKATMYYVRNLEMGRPVLVVTFWPYDVVEY